MVFEQCIYAFRRFAEKALLASGIISVQYPTVQGDDLTRRIFSTRFLLLHHFPPRYSKRRKRYVEKRNKRNDRQDDIRRERISINFTLCKNIFLTTLTRIDIQQDISFFIASTNAV